MFKYWIIVASCDHVQRGVAGGFAQACHGKAAPLRRMKKGDGVIFYSPKEKFGENKPCQASCHSIAVRKDDEVFQVEVEKDSNPSRRRIEFFKSQQAPAKSLVDRLTFIKDKTRWGGAFRYGFLEIPEQDFQTIKSVMKLSN